MEDVFSASSVARRVVEIRSRGLMRWHDIALEPPVLPSASASFGFACECGNMDF